VWARERATRPHMQHVGGCLRTLLARLPRALRVDAPGVGALLLVVFGCGPSEPRDRCRLAPTFIVTLSMDEGTFPTDTRVVFTHGSGSEQFLLSGTNTPQVVFCDPERVHPDEGSAGGGGEGGASARTNTSNVDAIVCELWTGGPTQVSVFSDAFEPLEDHPLRTDRDLCTVEEAIELDTGPPEKP